MGSDKERPDDLIMPGDDNYTAAIQQYYDNEYGPSHDHDTTGHHDNIVYSTEYHYNDGSCYYDDCPSDHYDNPTEGAA